MTILLGVIKYLFNFKCTNKCEIVHGDKIIEFYEKELTEYWLRRQQKYPLISKGALLISVPIASTNFCETVFSQLEIIKTIRILQRVKKVYFRSEFAHRCFQYLHRALMYYAKL